MGRKSKAELLAEVEEMQKKIAPDLYDGTSDEGSVEEIATEVPAPIQSDEIEPQKEEVKVVSEPELDFKAELEKTRKELADAVQKASMSTGRLNAAAEEARLLKERLALMEQQLELMKVQKVKEPEKAQIDDTELALIDAYGEDSDIVKLHRRHKAAEKELETKFETRFSEIVSRLDGVTRVAERTVQDKFFDTLSSQVNDWETIRDNPQFAEFLKQRAPFSRKTMYEIAVEAEQSFDATTVADVYKAFKSASQVQPVETTTVPAGVAPKKTKESLIAPNTTSRAVGEKTDIEYFTPEQVRDMTANITKLKETGRVKEAQAIASRLDAFLENIAG